MNVARAALDFEKARADAWDEYRDWCVRIRYSDPAMYEAYEPWAWERMNAKIAEARKTWVEVA